MHRSKIARIVALVLIASMVLTPVAYADQGLPTLADGPGDVSHSPELSHRLIVELSSPPLAAAHRDRINAAGVDGRLNVNAPDAQSYIAQLQAEQAAFVGQMQSALQGAEVSTFINELGVAEEASYQIVFNGIAVNPGAVDRDQAKAVLERMPGVKAVHYDRAYASQLYTSTSLINAPAVWNSAAIGGVENAGAGIKFASVDGGLHKDAPMFSGNGFVYPPGYGPNGLGLTSNNNGKIIVSRAYFRSWDPPAQGDDTPWAGAVGTSHGVHTASTAAGNCIENVDYLGYPVGSMCGVAPGAWAMSYRVFYTSVNGNESFYTAEGVAALEDIVSDGADVVQNSWGEGPISEGGQFDPIDSALINASLAGIFVSMSNGNSGPNNGTADHPSPEYINVAASTSGGTLAAGLLSLKNEPTMQDLAFAIASFGGQLPLGQIMEFDYLPAANVESANFEGCNPWPAETFAGKTALISRGNCEFGVKVLNAEQAGAEFVVVYNHAAGGDGLVSMGPGAVGEQVSIPSVFVGQTDGLTLVDFYNTGGAEAAILELSTIAFQAGNDPDYMIGFSSRGPAVGNTLKPDITAPGVNILAQGFTPNATGEARHLGYGQASGTSMAGPHVAGAAVLLRQLYPDWSNAAIKSAMMSTSKYMGIYNGDGSPAQPLDMGAGRLDVAAATDPGIILDPPSLSYGQVVSGTQSTIEVTVTSVADAAETYTISTLYTGDSYTMTTPVAGITADVASVTLNPGESKTIQVTFDSVSGTGYGDNQGFVVMTGDNGHEAHMPLWARVILAEPLADVLIIDADASFTLGNYDYSWYYTNTLEQLGYTYNIWDADSFFGLPATLPDQITLTGHEAIVLYTGEAYQPDGTFTVSTPLTVADQDRLVQYLNDGGSLIIMGQDFASLLDAAEFDADVGSRNFLYSYRLGANYVQDSVSDGQPPTDMIVPTSTAPAALAGATIDLTGVRKYNGSGELSGVQEVPPVATETVGSFGFDYDVDQNLLEVYLQVIPTATVPIEVTGAHIHLGAVNENGGVVRSLEPEADFFPVTVTDTLDIGISITDLISTEIDAMLANSFYINVHTTANPSGEVRGQLVPDPYYVQLYVDEIDNVFHDGSQDPDPDGTTSESNLGSNLILRYQGPNNVFDGAVTAAHRDQVSLERPGIDYAGRSIYATFGLEGVNESPGNMTRAQILGAMLAWIWAEPMSADAISIADISDANASNLTVFEVTVADGEVAAAAADAVVSYRWDFGDGSEYVTSATNTVGHVYSCSLDGDNNVTVRVELVDDLGITTIADQTFDVSDTCQAPTALDRDPEPLPGNSSKIYLPFIERN